MYILHMYVCVVYIYTCSHGCGIMCVQGYRHTCTQMWRPILQLYTKAKYLAESTVHRFIWLVWLTRFLWDPIPVPHVLGLQMNCHVQLAFTWVLGI